MGGDGIAIALVILLLLLYVLPALFRRRTVLNEAPIDEKYAQELRIIQARTHKITRTHTERGTIFTTERNMEPITRAKAARRPKTLDVRAVARKRAQAKARIAKRYSYHVRGMVAGTALVGLSVLFWILVAAVSLSSVVAGISTAVGAVYLGALTMMINVWQKYDAADRARIERYDAILAGAGSGEFVARQDRAELADAEVARGEAGSVRDADDSSRDAKRGDVARGEAMLSGAAGKQAKGMSVDHVVRVANKQAMRRGNAASKNNDADGVASEAGVVADSGAGVSAGASAGIVAGAGLNVAKVVAGKSGVGKSAAARERAGSAVENAQNVAVSGEARKQISGASTPGYTLKPRIQKRKVKPFVAPESAVAAVPYRPATLGERLGDGAVEAAHEAPQMTGNEELRQDLLGSGAALDNLLDRRRA
ncbi:DUF6667 domain-containing protein [Arcanobacterium bovis]|uniref:DUF6667 domain-containing protein n=1 Tax=Arcanobacterium bovis TaxID=2529275 RepID=A0A4Q9V473_9ACTO|nr:DUF6667 domain-containing protein [Arcanobacterium bovis]TBW23797.1 hypothetical protein EZJ44_01285 [Arcanobacterium bovis]